MSNCRRCGRKLGKESFADFGPECIKIVKKAAEGFCVQKMGMSTQKFGEHCALDFASDEGITLTEYIKANGNPADDFSWVWDSLSNHGFDPRPYADRYNIILDD